MAAAPALIVLVAPAMDQSVLLALTAGATETIRPARLLQGGLAFLLGAVELDEPRQRQAGLGLNPTHGHGKQLVRAYQPRRQGLLTELAT